MQATKFIYTPKWDVHSACSSAKGEKHGLLIFETQPDIFAFVAFSSGLFCWRGAGKAAVDAHHRRVTIRLATTT